jgi:hypothetical protein
MSRMPILIVCVLWASGCGDRAGDGFGGVAGPPEWELYEPVVRHLLPRATAAKAAVVRLSLPEGGDTALFCRRFADAAVPVRPAAADRREPDAYLIKIYDISGEKVQWQGPDSARVFVLDHHASESLRCGTPYPVPVHRDDNRWVVNDR